MMDIKIGDFQIVSDSLQFTLLKKEKKGPKAKVAGTHYVLCGYYSNLQTCLNEIPRHLSLRADCITLESLFTLLKEYKEMIDSKFKTITPKEVIPTSKKLMRTK